MNRVQVSAEGAALDAPTRRRCASFLRRVLRRRKLEGWELSLLLCDDGRIRELNRRYRGIDRPTDVLSFSQREGGWPPAEIGAAAGSLAHGGTGKGAPARPGPTPAGDIVISMDTLRRNAARRGIGTSEELKRLLIHGILHLEGMEHPEEERPAGAKGQTAMIVLQEELLRELRRGRLL